MYRCVCVRMSVCILCIGKGCTHLMYDSAKCPVILLCIVLKRILQFAHQEEGERWRRHFFHGPVLKRALDHMTHWRRPGFLFLNRQVVEERFLQQRSKHQITLFVMNITTAVKTKQNKKMCLPTEFTDSSYRDAI